jgi:hypothetical protein
MCLYKFVLKVNDILHSLHVSELPQPLRCLSNASSDLNVTLHLLHLNGPNSIRDDDGGGGGSCGGGVGVGCKSGGDCVSCGGGGEEMTSGDPTKLCKCKERIESIIVFILNKRR